MPRLRVESFTISLDGFGAGPDRDLNNPLGVGGTALHGWALTTRTFQRKLFGVDAGQDGIDEDFGRRSRLGCHGSEPDSLSRMDPEDGSARLRGFWQYSVPARCGGCRRRCCMWARRGAGLSFPRAPLSRVDPPQRAAILRALPQRPRASRGSRRSRRARIFLARAVDSPAERRIIRGSPG